MLTRQSACAPWKAKERHAVPRLRLGHAFDLSRVDQIDDEIDDRSRLVRARDDAKPVQLDLAGNDGWGPTYRPATGALFDQHPIVADEDREAA